MASSFVSEFSAVLVALEHLKELEAELKEEGAPLSSEAILHLRAISTAITQLEAERRAAHEHLEVESIENGELRHRIDSMREQVSREILADAAAARATNAEELRQLRQHLGATAQTRGAAEKRHEGLVSQNEALRLELEQMRAEQEDAMAALDHQISQMFGLQAQLGRTERSVEELKTRLAAAGRDKTSLQESRREAREALAAETDNLTSDVEQVQGKIRRQKQAIRRLRGELDKVRDKEREARDSLGQLEVQAAGLENGLSARQATRRRRENQLAEEAQRQHKLKQQRETLKEELRGFGEALGAAVQRLREEVMALEGKVEEVDASRTKGQNSFSDIYKVFSCQSEEEKEARAEHHQVSRQLERSTLQVEELIASIVKHSKEIEEMEKRMVELQEAYATNRRVFERNREKLRGDVDAGKKLVAHFEEERKRLTWLLEEKKKEQRDHVAKMTSDLSRSSRRYEELQQEKANIPRLQPTSASRMNELEGECGRVEAQQRHAIHRCAAQLENITRSNQDKQREVEEKEEMLEEAKAKFNQEESRHQELQMLSSELQRKRNDLEVLIQRLAERTSSQMQPKEEMKAELEQLQAAYMGLLRKQASELSGVEMSIYDGKAKLEQVSMENSRLRLCIKEMVDDVARTRRSLDAYRREIPRFQRDTTALAERIREAWREDLLLTQQSQGSDGALLASMSGLLSHLRTRRHQLGAVSALLQQHGGLL